MSDFDDLTGRLTARLRVDPELRMDVANELRAHLQDAAAEFRDAGYSAADAAANAVKALGDEKQLTEQLWEANRTRIRLRSVIRWAARVTLIPAAIVVIIVLIVGLRGGSSLYLGHDEYSYWEEWMLSTLGFSLPAGLTEEQRFIHLGDPGAETPLEQVKSISDRWPDNPVYYGNYVVALMEYGDFYDRDRGRLKPDRLSEMLPILDRGERIDPDNAFYNFMKASWLIQTASTISEDPSRTYEKVRQDDKVRTDHCWRIEIHDPEQFRRGLGEFRRGVDKSECTDHSVNMMKLRLDLLPEPKRFNDYMRHIALGVTVLIPRLSDYRALVRSLSAHAIALAEAGRADEADEIIKSVERMAVKQGARSRTIIELLVAHAIRTMALGHAEQVYKELHRPRQAARAQGAYREEVAFFNRIFKGPRLDQHELVYAGILAMIMTPGLPGYQIDFEPMRSAEQFVATEMGLLLLLAVLVVSALLLGGLAVLSLLVQRRENRPVLLFVGWGRIGKICLLSILLPLGVYAFYAYVLTSGDRAYGLYFTAGKTALEFTVTISLMCTLLAGLSYSAIRRRGEEIGLAVPPPLRMRDRRWIAGIGALVALAVVIYLVGWWAGPFKPTSLETSGSVAGAVLAAVVVAFLLIWVVREFVGLPLRKQYARFRRTLYRSLVPIIASAVIVVGIFCGWALGRAEGSAVRRIRGSAGIGFRSEIERSNYRLLRDRFIEQHEAMMAESHRQ